MAIINSKDVNRLALPAMVAAIAEPLINIADSAIIGRYSEDPVIMLGAVGIASSFFLSFIWVFSQTRTAMSSVLSRYYGANKIEDVKTLIPQMILLNFILGFFFYLVTNLFIETIFTALNAKGEILKNAIDYFSIRSIGFPFVLSTLMIFGVFRGMQNTLWAMAITITAGLLNLGLDFIFINGWGEYIAPMGIKGVAFASITAQLLMFTLAIIFLYVKTPFNLNFVSSINKEVGGMLQLAGNFIIRSIAVNTAYFFMTRLASGYGESYIAVQHICINIWFFSAFFIEGYCNAGNVLAGKYRGQEDYKGIWDLSTFIRKNAIKLALGLMLFLALLYPFIGSFFVDKKETIEIFNSVFWMVLLTLPLNAIAFSYDELFKGLGKGKYLRNTLLMATFLCFLPLIFLFDSLDFKIHAIWTAFIGWMAFRGIRLRYLFHKKYKKHQ